MCAGKNGTTPTKAIPLVLCGDLNSLPESGVVEFLDNGRVLSDHPDLQDLAYEGFLARVSNGRKSGDANHELGHAFKLRKAYEEEKMPYTNYTYEFKGVIDYIYYTCDSLVPLGVLASISEDYIKENKIIGWPHPHFPSDHQSLLVEFETVAGAPGYTFGPGANHLTR